MQSVEVTKRTRRMAPMAALATFAAMGLVPVEDERTPAAMAGVPFNRRDPNYQNPNLARVAVEAADSRRRTPASMGGTCYQEGPRPLQQGYGPQGANCPTNGTASAVPSPTPLPQASVAGSDFVAGTPAAPSGEFLLTLRSLAWPLRPKSVRVPSSLATGFLFTNVYINTHPTLLVQPQTGVFGFSLQSLQQNEACIMEIPGWWCMQGGFISAGFRSIGSVREDGRPRLPA